MRRTSRVMCHVVLVAGVFCSTVCLGQEAVDDKDAQAAAGAPVSGEHSATDLAKKTQNPVSDLISVPFENSFNFGAGKDGEFSYTLTIKPVFPQSLNEDWNWIHRALIPVMSQPGFDRERGPVQKLRDLETPIRGALSRLIPGVDDACGLGDIQYQGYLSPSKPGKWVWGVGPVFEFPTATPDDLGSEKWSTGPGAVLLRMDGPWVYGTLVNNIWSFAGNGDRDSVNRTTIQPFVNYNLAKGWYLGTSPVMTANWSADSHSEIWTVPLGGLVGRIVKIGKLPLNINAQGYYNVLRPDAAPDWELKLQVALLFPK